jgi:3-oxoacyl-[acyl-carrier-protein] synthase III
MSAYITSIGKFLPNAPVENDQVEEYLGKIFDKPSATKHRMLEKNGILTRFYAMDKNQKTTHSASQMAQMAIEDCLLRASAEKKEIDYLAAATTQGDLPVPGFASMVQGDSGIGPCEIATLHGVCGSGMMAIQGAFLQVKANNKKNAIVCAAELPSRLFKAKRFENQSYVKEKGYLPSETDFLRWMLSDGAGSMLIQPQPHAHKLSLKIKWIDIVSYAHLFDVCMYAGKSKNGSENSTTWLDEDSFEGAALNGTINLKQDLKLVDNIVKLGVKRFFELIEEGKIDPKAIDQLVCHYSSHIFKGQIVDLLSKGGLDIPEEKWFTNLYSKGNTGSASIFILLEELLNEKELKPGQQILCMVPESGRFLTSFMMLEVTAPTSEKERKNYAAAIKPPEIQISGGEVQQFLIRQLTNVWIDFETQLNQVSVVKKIHNGTLSMEEYKMLIYNIRQQVIDGSQWIARAASNVSMDYFDVRSAFITHSRDEHRDYQILEKNYVACGGDIEYLKKGDKNIGTEALSAYMFYRASLPNPFDLLGGMFIIEGLGNRVAGRWGRAIKDQLNLKDDQVSFLIYHESSDSNENHFERFEKAVASELLTMPVAKQIVKTAKTVARLYCLQLQELGNY